MVKKLKIKKKKKKKFERPRLSYHEIEVIKAILAIENNVSEAARQTGRARDTIRRIRDLNEQEIDNYRQLKRKEFVSKAWEKIELLLDEITKGKCYWATINQITTAIGTLYDKAALASGDITERIGITGIEYIPVNGRESEKTGQGN